MALLGKRRFVAGIHIKSDHPLANAHSSQRTRLTTQAALA